MGLEKVPVPFFSRVCRVRNKVDKGFDKKVIKTLRGMGYVLEGN